MPKFEKKFVHFMWNDELNGKKCFVSDYIDDLVEKVVKNKTESCKKVTCSKNKSFPFQTCANIYVFAYYDPYYELKVAEEQGKTIQYLVKVTGGERWEDVHEPIWNDMPDNYRIKPDEPNRTVTNRELARWLAMGNGEYTEKGLRDTSINCYASFNYSSLFQDDPIPGSFLIRKWDDDEWHSPTREYMGLNTQEV